MGRKPAITRDELLAAAMAFVDQFGLEALSLRSLAPYTGVSHTAMYTHFATKGDMVNALAASVLADVLTTDVSGLDTPREQLTAMAHAIRNGLLKHPNLVPAFLTAAGMSEETRVITAGVITLLEAGGLEGRDAVVTYQALEAFVFGFVIYEVGTDANFLEVRRSRYQAVRHPETLKAAKSNAAMRKMNADAFATGFERLLDASGL
jgi:TetR/AcrR family transcriptional regulator, tetracycline repressor protein